MSHNPSRRLRRRQTQEAQKGSRRRYLEQTTAADRAVHRAARRLFHMRKHDAVQAGDKFDEDEQWEQAMEDAEDAASIPGETYAERVERLAAEDATGLDLAP